MESVNVEKVLKEFVIVYIYFKVVRVYTREAPEYRSPLLNYGKGAIIKPAPWWRECNIVCILFLVCVYVVICEKSW